MKAVVLAGGPGSATFDLANCYSKLAFPMADGRPLFTHLLRAMRERGLGGCSGPRQTISIRNSSERRTVSSRLTISSG